MQRTVFALLIAVAFGFSAMSQTIAGYEDGELDANSQADALRKERLIEFPGNPVEGLQAVLRLPTDVFEVGSNIEAEIVIKNVSRKAKSLSAAFPLLANGFAVRIVDKERTVVPMTNFGKAQQISGEASPNVSRRLQPGGEMVFPLELHKLYQLESPGVYSIQITKSFRSSDKVAKHRLATGEAQITIQLPTDVRKR